MEQFLLCMVGSISVIAAILSIVLIIGIYHDGGHGG